MWGGLSVFCGLFLWILLFLFVDSYGIKPTLCSGQTKDLRKMTYTELNGFFQSFDNVITDIDGVLMKGTSPIPGTIEVLRKLENRKKSTLFLTNNSFFTVQDYVKMLRHMKYRATPDSIITPATTLIYYLKNMDFEGKAFVIGNKRFTKALVDDGIQVLTGPDSIEEDPQLLKNITKIDEDVKAVIVEFDVNVNWAKIVQASAYLQNKDILFLVGASDKKVPTDSKNIIGPGYFADILANYSGRTPISYTKSGSILRDFITDNFVEMYSRRVLFIGDSLDIDMKFGAACNFTTLWIGSGVDKDTDSENCKVAPDYYLSNLSGMPFVNCTD